MPYVHLTAKQINEIQTHVFAWDIVSAYGEDVDYIIDYWCNNLYETYKRDGYPELGEMAATKLEQEYQEAHKKGTQDSLFSPPTNVCSPILAVYCLGWMSHSEIPPLTFEIYSE